MGIVTEYWCSGCGKTINVQHASDAHPPAWHPPICDRCRARLALTAIPLPCARVRSPWWRRALRWFKRKPKLSRLELPISTPPAAWDHAVPMPERPDSRYMRPAPTPMPGELEKRLG